MAWWSNLDDDIYASPSDFRAAASATSSSLPETWPEILRHHVNGPTAVLARHLATPNYEMLWFSRLARRHGFRTMVIEHTSDKFTAHNPAKLALATIPIITGRSRNGRPIFRRQRLLDPITIEGLRLDELQTHTGERVLDYHHRKLVEIMGPDTPNRIDLREIVSPDAMDPAGYYRSFFGMLLGNLVLFEDFVADEQTAIFFQATVLPAWRDVVAATDRRPQIVRLTPGGRATAPLWLAYPSAMADNPQWVRRQKTREIGG